MTTPFFLLWRARLAGLGRKTTQSLRQSTLGQLRESLSRFIPPALLVAQEEGPNSRERVFPLGLTFQCFIWQMLNPHTSCREVVRHVQTLLRLAGLMPIDDSDSAYVQARQRFPRQRLDKALHQTAQAADRRVGKGGRLGGRPVKVVDGSTTQLPDTKKNQQRYPQPSAQKPGCGFPVMKFVVLFSLASGASFVRKIAIAAERNGWLNMEIPATKLYEFAIENDIEVPSYYSGGQDAAVKIIGQRLARLFRAVTGDSIAVEGYLVHRVARPVPRPDGNGNFKQKFYRILLANPVAPQSPQ